MASLGFAQTIVLHFGRYMSLQTEENTRKECFRMSPGMLFERSRLTQSEKDAYRILPLDVRLFSVGSMNSRELVIPNDLSCDVTRS